MGSSIHAAIAIYILASFPGRKTNGQILTAHVSMRMLQISIIQIGIWNKTRSKYTKAIKVCSLWVSIAA